MIKSGTEAIYPSEVEQVVATLAGVTEVSVVGMPDEEWGESVRTLVVRAPGARLDAAAIIEYCGRQLAGYKKPPRASATRLAPTIRSTTIAGGSSCQASWCACHCHNVPRLTLC